MQKQNIKDTLVRITGPLGPTKSLDQRAEDQKEWVNHLELEDLAALEEILITSEESYAEKRIDGEEVKTLAAEGLMQLMTGKEEASIEVLERLIRNPESEVAVIDAMGEAKAVPMLTLLTSRMEEEATSEVLVAMAGAIGAIGGEEARKVLRRMQVQYRDLKEVQEEINIGLQ